MSGAAGAGAPSVSFSFSRPPVVAMATPPVTAWVLLVKQGYTGHAVSVSVTPSDSVMSAIDAVCTRMSVELYVRALVKDAFSEDLVGIGRTHIQLFLSDETGIEASTPTRNGSALKPNKTLLSEVLSRLNPTGAGAGASFPDPLYLLAVAEGA